MRLPQPVYSDGIQKSVQTQFGGLNHTPGAGDGELWDMRNLTGDLFPLLSPRPARRLARRLENPGGLYCWESLCWVDGTGFYFDGEQKGTVTAGEKRFAALGAYIIILPDKAFYNVESGEFGALEARWSGNGVTFTNGTLFGEEAEANTLQCAGADWSKLFRAGDAVTISGCTTHPENNKTPVIREIDGDRLIFYEFCFTLDGEEGNVPYSEAGSVTIARTVPDLRFICENENRLWGCDARTIYGSKLGDPFNWNVFEGLSTDSYAVDTGSAGSFTACVSYLGYPVFFKEEHIYKVYGSLPSNFEVMGSTTLGVMEGSAASLAIAGETLYYLSRAGIMAYSGGVPKPVSAPLGLGRFRDAHAGSDGLKYYVSMRGEEGWRLYCYDTQRRLWHIEDETQATHFAFWNGNLYCLNGKGEVWILGRAFEVTEGEEEEAVHWRAEFGDFTEGSPNKKGVSKMQIRLELDEGATVEAMLRFDSVGEWIPVGGVLYEGAKRSYYLPIVPRRGDHYRLKLEGVGGCRVYSIAREFYDGSELRSQPGRQ